MFFKKKEARPFWDGPRFWRWRASGGERFVTSHHEMVDHLLHAGHVAEVREAACLPLYRHREVGLFGTALFADGISERHGQLLNTSFVLACEQL